MGAIKKIIFAAGVIVWGYYNFISWRVFWRSCQVVGDCGIDVGLILLFLLISFSVVGLVLEFLPRGKKK